LLQSTSNIMMLPCNVENLKDGYAINAIFFDQ
jgi:hypothetical protein